MGAKGSKPGAPTPVAGAPVAPNAPVAPVAMATNAGGQLNITKRSTYQTFKNSVKGRVMGTGTTGDARAQLAKAVASGNGNLVDPGVLRAAIQSGANIEGIINTPLIAPYRTFDFARKLTRVDVFKLLFAGKEFKQSVINVNNRDGKRRTYMENVLGDLVEVLNKIMMPKKSFTGSVIQNPDCKPVDPSIIKMVAIKLALLLQNPLLNEQTTRDFAFYLSDIFTTMATQVADAMCIQFRDDAIKVLIKSLNDLSDGSKVYAFFLDKINTNEFVVQNLSDWESKKTNVKNIVANTGIRNVNRGATKKVGYFGGTTADPVNKEFDKLRKEKVQTWKEFEKLDTNVLGVPGNAQKLNNVAVKDIYNVHEVLTLLGRKVENRHQDCDPEDYIKQNKYEMELFEYIVTRTPPEVANKPLGMMQSNKTPLLYVVKTTLDTLREPCPETDENKKKVNKEILSRFAKKLFLMISNGFIYSVKDGKGMGVLEYLTEFIMSTNPKDCDPKSLVKVFNELVKMDRQSQNPTFKNFVKELRARFGNTLRSNVNWNGKLNVASVSPVANVAPASPVANVVPVANVAPVANALVKNVAPVANALVKNAAPAPVVEADPVAPAAQQVGNAAAVAAANAGAPPAAVEAAQAVAEASAANGDPAAQVAEQTEQAVTENGGSKQAAIQAGNAAGAVQAANAPSLNQVSNSIGKNANRSKINAFLAEPKTRKSRRFRNRLTRSYRW